jgi:YidC/Oxa1 family membrane protein insertase
MGLFGTTNFESDELKRFNSLKPEEREIVFYSEDKNSAFIYESLINELVDIHRLNVCYVSSNKEDPILTQKNNKIKTFYIGEGTARTKFFLTLKTNIIIMTMPDLETLNIKRSKVHPVHYVYLFHSMVSTHLAYRKEAFDNFDTIFCVGNYQIEEIRSAEKIYELKPKKLIKYGYSHLDNLIERFSKYRINSSKKIHVLIAPSWGKDGLFNTLSRDIIKILLETEYKVTLRLHPMTLKKSKNEIKNIQEEFLSNTNFVLETDVTNFETIFSSDVIISDWSGIALEYAFSQKKPVVYINVSKKINNKDYEKNPHVPIEESIRKEIGVLVEPSEIELLPKKIKGLIEQNNIFHEKIEKIRDKTIFNIGKSVEEGGKEIINLLNQIRHERAQD